LSDLIRALAFAYRRKGATSIPGGDLRLLLAYDLRWFAPEDAKRVVQRAIEVGLLRDENGALAPAFDVAAVEIPINFRPTTQVLEEEIAFTPVAPPRAPPTTIAPAASVAPIAPAAPAEPPVTARVASSEIEKAADDERRRRGLLMGSEVARLVVRRRAGEDVAADAAALEAAALSAGARSQA